MRQFLLGLLVAGLAWWIYATWFVDPVVGGADAGGAAGVAEGRRDPAAPPLDLTRMLGAAPTAATGPLPLDASARKGSEAPPASAGGLNGIDELLPRVAQRDADAITLAWTALATGRGGADRQRLADALAAPADDFAAMLSLLGTNNAFLHSAEGRANGGKVLAAALSMPDAEACTAASLLLALSLRGRIERGDTEVRAFVENAYRQHRIRVDRWLCDPANVARSRSHTVEKGDSLARIAAKFRREGVQVEDGTLAVLNRIHNPNAVQIGQKIKVPIDPIFAVIEKRSYSMAVYLGEHLLRLYWVGHGENDKTPVTEFTVAEKQPRPEWTAPDGQRYPYGHPNNILGEYFIKFRHDRYTGFGAHGTPMPDTIGTMSSMGCIRMLAPDIAELFQLLPRGAKVQVLASESVR
ncbi:MAG: L,D-transpeptidase family protein [Planctomycetes bacterium]|nr:L,D-transpeptidase family protein [Planctomycetota bacterium]